MKKLKLFWIIFITNLHLIENSYSTTAVIAIEGTSTMVPKISVVQSINFGTIMPAYSKKGNSASEIFSMDLNNGDFKVSVSDRSSTGIASYIPGSDARPAIINIQSVPRRALSISMNNFSLKIGDNQILPTEQNLLATFFYESNMGSSFGPHEFPDLIGTSVTIPSNVAGGVADLKIGLDIPLKSGYDLGSIVGSFSINVDYQ